METTNDQPTLNAKQSSGLGKCIQLNTWMKFYRQLWLIMEPTWALLEHVRTTSRRYFLNTLRLVVRLSMQDKTNFPFIHSHERWLSFISGISWLNINQSPAFKLLLKLLLLLLLLLVGWGGADLDSDEAKTRSKRTKEQVQTKNRNKNNTFQSDTPAGRRIGHRYLQL